MAFSLPTLPAMPVTNPQTTRDIPDPKNILPDNEKRRQNATDCAQGLDSYIKSVEASVKLRQAQG